VGKNQAITRRAFWVGQPGRETSTNCNNEEVRGLGKHAREARDCKWTILYTFTLTAAVVLLSQMLFLPRQTATVTFLEDEDVQEAPWLPFTVFSCENAKG
jgi:hypothetical protein